MASLAVRGLLITRLCLPQMKATDADWNTGGDVRRPWPTDKLSYSMAARPRGHLREEIKENHSFDELMKVGSMTDIAVLLDSLLTAWELSRDTTTSTSYIDNRQFGFLSSFTSPQVHITKLTSTDVSCLAHAQTDRSRFPRASRHGNRFIQLVTEGQLASQAQAGAHPSVSFSLFAVGHREPKRTST